MKHIELVERAAKWLKGQRPLGGYHIKPGCGVVVTETGPALGEQPDAIGFTGHASYLIEVKTSRSDFKADSKKPWRRVPERGMGDYRLFLCVPDLISPDELPDKWGLLYCHPNKIELVKSPERQEASDYKMLYSLIRRAVCQGFNPQGRYKDFIAQSEPPIGRDV